MRIAPQIYDDFFRVCCEEKVTVIEVSGSPATKYINMVHEAGVKIMHKVGAVRHAINIEKIGYDAVIAAGIEEGGHPLNDDVTTMVLTPVLSNQLKFRLLQLAALLMDGGWQPRFVWEPKLYLWQPDLLPPRNVKFMIIFGMN